MLTDFHVLDNAQDSTSIFPLYLYPETQATNLFAEKTRRPNLNEKLVAELAARLGRQFSPEKSTESGTFCPLDMLDYVYAVLHTPAYRAKYREFLKIDFPRVPWPADAAQFDRLVALGGRLRQLHLLESADLEELETGFPVGGDNLVGKPSFTPTPDPSPKGGGRRGKVNINQSQYFEHVPEVAWQFYIGGYQPAQKWLKDRAGRKLNFEEVMHYQKIIAALARTAEVMEALDAAWAG